jgi:extracellular factor (EF) 3-hydroxypalmitic acid methyl ester biosynthesis protein
MLQAGDAIALTQILDTCHSRLLDCRSLDSIDELVQALFKLRSSTPGLAWEKLVSICRRHPICPLLHEDPLTHRSFTKPRGYAGDAVMLDMIYDAETIGVRCSELGRAVFRYTAGCGRSPQAVRHRRSLIAQIVDRLSSDEKRPRILSIASGHLREAEMSIAFKNRRIEEWVAIDQDEQSLAECERRFSGSVIRPLRGSVRQLLAGKLPLGHFDFVYAAGLFDYLSRPIASALLSRMFEMLGRNGTLLVANFASEFVDAGYMEAFMDWRLTYRSTREMQGLLDVLEENGASNIALFPDAWNSIIYASADKRGS